MQEWKIEELERMESHQNKKTQYKECIIEAVSNGLERCP